MSVGVGGLPRKRDAQGALVGPPAWQAAQEHLPGGMDARDREALHHAFIILDAMSRNTVVLIGVDAHHMQDPLTVQVRQQTAPSTEGPDAPDRLFYEVAARFAPQVLLSLGELNRLRAVHDEYMSEPVVRVSVDVGRVECHFTLHSQTQRPPSTVTRRQVVTIYREHSDGSVVSRRGGAAPRPSDAFALAPVGHGSGGGAGSLSPGVVAGIFGSIFGR